MATDKKQPIIIKKITKKAAHGHHGGSWKIAYADFVTAMMAFFLLMWLLNATSEQQKRGIANYFSPVSIGVQGGGNWGVMGGMSIADSKGSLSSSSSHIQVKPQPTREKGLGATGKAKEKTDAAETIKNKPEEKINELQKGESKQLAQVSLRENEHQPLVSGQQQNREQEQKSFEAIKDQIKQSIQQTPDLKDLFNNLTIDQTEEGLRIQIIDRDKRPMFPNGSSRMYQQMKELLEKVADAIQTVPNKISISGHTDASPYSNDRTFSNWELSTERANASRRVLKENGVSDDRFQSIVGRADKELFNKADPKSEENRRISIVLLYQNEK